MQTAELLAQAFARIQRAVHQATEGLDASGLTYRPEPGANSIAWLVWHLTRVQDDHVSDIAGRQQLWDERGWAACTGIDRDVGDTGRGDGPIEVGAVKPSSVEQLLAYHDEVIDRTVSYLADAEDLDRIIDTSYDPPVSVGTRLLSVVNDSLQHAGQARYLRGMIDRLNG